MQEDVKMRVDEVFKTFEAMDKVCKVRSVSLVVKRKLYERVLVTTVKQGATQGRY